MLAEQNALVIEYAKSCLGVPYRWGGNNRLVGFDCSGFMCDILRSFGQLDSRQDLTATKLWSYLLDKGALEITDDDRHFPATTVLFYGQQGKYRHVAMVVDWHTLIEAGGGDSGCISIAQAADLGAMVRLRSVFHRTDLVGALLPKWPWDHQGEI